MGLWDRIKGEFIDVIEWLDDSNDTLVYRFERHQNEIKNGAQLIVREGQTAVFVNEGQIADIFVPGRYELTTKNLPILTTLKNWDKLFNSPFKAEVYFVSTRQFTDQKWGTPNPVMLRDKEFGPVRIRAFGNYAFKIEDPGKLIKEIVGTDGHFQLDEIVSQLRNVVLTRFTDAIGEANIPVLDLASNYDELSSLVENKISHEYRDYGLGLTKFLIANISLPEEVEKAIDKRSTMGIIGNLDDYTKLQSADAIKAAAENPNGGAGEGIGMGMGFGMANQMMNQMNQQQQQQNQSANNQQPSSGPPPVPQAVQYYVAVNGNQTGPYDLAALKQMASNSQFNSESVVWTEGMANWDKAGNIAELRTLFGSVPPPIPPNL